MINYSVHGKEERGDTTHNIPSSFVSETSHLIARTEPTDLDDTSRNERFEWEFSQPEIDFRQNAQNGNRICFLIFGIVLVSVLVIGMIPRILMESNGSHAWFRRTSSDDKDAKKGSRAHMIRDEDSTSQLDKDEHGCILSAGFTWCEQLQTCIQPWITLCPP